MLAHHDLYAELERQFENDPAAFYRRFAEARVALAGLKPSQPPHTVADMVVCIVQAESRVQHSTAVPSALSLVSAIRW